MTELTQTEAYAFPSIMRDVPFNVYMRIHGLSCSAAKIILDKSPYHYRNQEAKETDAMRRGTLLHEMVLEPDARRYRILPESADKSSKKGILNLLFAYAEWMDLPASIGDAKMDDLRKTAELMEGILKDAGLYVVTQEDHDRAVRMRDSLMRNPILRTLLEDGGDAEATLLWTHPEHGCPQKARADYLPAAHGAILDLKTTKDASWDEIMRTIARWHYHWQAAHYAAGAAATGLGRLPFVLAFVESEPPHASRLISLDDHATYKGRLAMDRAAEIYAECVKADRWPAYPETIETAILPGWAK